MTSPPRFALRFESGERSGESVPVPTGAFVVGRRPGSSLQVVDSSVSGRHAELVLDESGLLLRDLGSTNGTRVNGERVLETRVGAGDEVVFGNVRFTVVGDGVAAARTDERKAPAPVAATARTTDGIASVSAERLARAGKRSKVGLFAALVLLLGGGAAFFFLRRPRAGGENRPARAVAVVPGNLAADPSFEGEADDPQAVGGEGQFVVAPDGARSGDMGLACDLAAGERALGLTAPTTIGAHEALTIGASLLVEEGIEAAVGVQFLPAAAQEDAAEESGGATWVFGPNVAAGDDFVDSSFTCLVPPGAARARIALFARARTAGAVLVDDLVLVPAAEKPAPVANVGDDSVLVYGNPPRSLTLARGRAPRLAGLELVPAAEETFAGRGLPLELEPRANGVRALAAGAESLVLRARVEADLAADGVATAGADGYQAHGGALERVGVTRLLLGGRRNLVQVRFNAPARVVLRPAAGGALALEAELGAGRGFDLQFEFREERSLAGDLAHEARKAVTAGELGRGLATWQQLLDEHPYDPELVAEADEARARLVRGGLQEVNDVRATLERARFFRLTDLYREALTAGRELTTRYAGTEVGAAAGAVVAEIEHESLTLERERSSHERARLERVHAALTAQGANELAAEVERYMGEHFR